MIGLALQVYLVGGAELGNRVAEDDFEARIVAEDREAIIAAHILQFQAEMADEEIRRRSDIGYVKIEMVQAHDSLRSKKSRDCNLPSPHAAGIPHFHADHVAGSRAMGYGAELLESAVDAPTEGIGLTSTDPAFFDAADLADPRGFGNGSADTITPFQAIRLEGLKLSMPFA